MTAFDIMPWDSNGSEDDVRHYRLDGSETFSAGMLVYIGADGDINGAGDSALGNQMLGIALAPARYSIGGTSTTKNPRTGVAYATGDMIPVAHLRPGKRVITRKFATDGAGTSEAPTLANALGETAGLIETGSGTTAVHWIDTGAAQDDLFRIVDVLDTNKNSLQDPKYSSNTGVYVVAECIQSMVTLTGDPLAS
jgi:hypothetical protein